MTENGVWAKTYYIGVYAKHVVMWFSYLFLYMKNRVCDDNALQPNKVVNDYQWVTGLFRMDYVVDCQCNNFLWYQKFPGLDKLKRVCKYSILNKNTNWLLINEVNRVNERLDDRCPECL